MKLIFITVSDYKRKEVTSFFDGSGIELQILHYPIQEILDINLDNIVRDKVIKAYKQVGSPCAVEHGGLFIDALNGFPGGLSKVVWDRIGDKLCSFIQVGDKRDATAKSVIGYCDGKTVNLFPGETRGTIAGIGSGKYTFQWDPIFIPNGTTKTYAELGFPAKAKFSQALIGWKNLIKHLKE